MSYCLKITKRLTALVLAGVLAFGGFNELTLYAAESVVESVGGESIQSKDISFVAVDQPWVDIPGTETVAVGIGANTLVDSATLSYKNIETGAVKYADVTNISAGAVEFVIDFDENSQIAKYTLDAITYTVNGREYERAFDDAGIEANFSVGTLVETNPDKVVEGTLSDEVSVSKNTEGLSAAKQAVVEDATVSMDVSVVDEKGTTTAATSLATALNQMDVVSDAVKLPVLGATSSSTSSKSKTVVVVLDPGHDASHAGSSGGGLIEAEINLKIAKYCKAELEKYTGVKVYMTRSSSKCPNGGSSVTAATCNAARVDFAASKKATIYVALHNNYSASPAASGCEVYYPNSNGNAKVGSEGQKAAKNVLNKLASLGLSNRGTKIRNSESGDSYADGSLMDYYGVIRRAKNYYSMPAIIVEHAFQSNPSDVSNFLGNNAGLKKLGVADAKGIVKTYGLSKDLKSTQISSISASGFNKVKLTWDAAAGATDYNILRRTEDQTEWTTVGTTSNLKYTDQTGKCNTKYYYTVQATAGTNLAKYDTTGVAVTTKNGKIKNLVAAEQTFDGINLQWDSKSGITQYQIYRAEWGVSGFTKIATTNTNSYNDTAVKKGRVYIYKVRAYYKSSAGKIYGAYSKECGLAYTAKCTPKISSIKAKNFNKNVVTWKKVSNASGYILYRSDKENGKYTEIARLAGKKNTTYTDETCKCGKTYYYRLKAYKMNGNKMIKSAEGEPKSVKTKENKVKITKIKTKNFNETKLTWNAVSKAGWYEIYRRTDNTSWEKIDSTIFTSYTDKTTGCGVRYYYAIKACKKVNRKTYSGKMDNRGVAYYTKENAVVQKSIKYTGEAQQIRWNGIDKATGYVVQRSLDGKNFQKLDDTSKKYYNDKDAIVGETYYYRVRAYRKVFGKRYYGKYSASKKVKAGFAITGKSSTTVEKMVKYYKANASYPKFYATSDAPTIEAFAQIYYDECNTEGIKAEVAFCQAMKETGFLKYGGDVKIEQYNFAGMGATGGGNPGNKYPDVRTGVRAHIQHLKAYANKDALKNKCVDDRFQYVTRGSAPVVEWLGINENPFKKGWATALRYGYSLKNDYIAKLLKY